MNKINWKVRFKNRQFVTRLVLALVLPILAYFGIKFEDLTSWGAVFGLLGKFVLNPYLVGLTISTLGTLFRTLQPLGMEIVSEHWAMKNLTKISIFLLATIYFWVVAFDFRKEQ